MQETTALFGQAEWTVHAGVQWLRLVVETLGAAVVAGGILRAAYLALVGLVRRRSEYAEVRLALARYLALALELQLAADILSTAVAPSWDQLGKLAVVAIIRTGLNFFLGEEMGIGRPKVREPGGEAAGVAPG